MRTQLKTKQQLENNFTQCVGRLGEPYSAPKFSRPIRLNLRELVPDFRNLLKNLKIYSLSLGLGTYPNTLALVEDIARKYQLTESNIVVTAGGDDALWQIIQAMIEPGRNLVVATPTFAMISRYVIMAGGEMRTVLWLDGEFPLDEFLKRIDENTGIILFVSPNNPTGRTVLLSIIQSVRKKCPRAVLVLDGVYLEYADQDITSDFLSLPGTLVIRSFSKSYGVPGLRVGYAMSRYAEIIKAMKTIGQPYPVSLMSIKFAQALLLPENEAKFRSAREVVKQNVRLFMQVLECLNIDYLPSDANFVFVRLASDKNAMQLYGLLVDQGIFVRSFENDPLISTCLCIGVPYEKNEIRFLITALQGIYAHQDSLSGAMSDAFKEVL